MFQLVPLEKFLAERLTGHGLIKRDSELPIGPEVDERIPNTRRLGHYGGDGDDIDWDIPGFPNNGPHADDCVWCPGPQIGS